MINERLASIMGTATATSDTCETVRIVRSECPGGFAEINLTDYDSSTMELYKDKK